MSTIHHIKKFEKENLISQAISHVDEHDLKHSISPIARSLRSLFRCICCVLYWVLCAFKFFFSSNNIQCSHDTRCFYVHANASQFLCFRAIRLRFAHIRVFFHIKTTLSVTFNMSTLTNRIAKEILNTYLATDFISA